MEQSITIITEYYKDNLTPFFDNVDDDILWIGPAEGQWIQGKPQLLAAWEGESHKLVFRMQDISAVCVPLGSSSCAVILQYGISTYYPSGAVLSHTQRLHYTWREHRVTLPDGKKERLQRIAIIHISNAEDGDERDNIYPVHRELAITQTQIDNVPERLPHLQVLAIDGTIHYLLHTSILYIETCKRSNRCRVHTRDGTLLIASSLAAFAQKAPDYFLRVHSAFLVNPLYVQSLKRFTCQMADGQSIPVPEKKYTWFKRELQKWNSNPAAICP